MIKSWILPVAVALGLSACVSTNTTFPEPLRDDTTYNWRVVDVQASVPRTLSTTDRNGQMPNVDLIWTEEGAGDVYAQIESIMEDTLVQAATHFQSSIKGNRAVILRTEQTQFHSLTQKARSNIGGIHNVDFILTVVDANTGEILAGPAAIEADVKAFGGSQANDSIARGETMRGRIIDRVSVVIASYLGIAGNQAITNGRVVQIGR
ncbi:MAG: hypothetical protein COB08_017555 [Rhodobacteraceae bacterium]|nr:hypothetical protein [Paracoccaceae bacterium]